MFRHYRPYRVYILTDSESVTAGRWRGYSSDINPIGAIRFFERMHGINRVDVWAWSFRSSVSQEEASKMLP